jgi:two-component system invasion response regulator UvrY
MANLVLIDDHVLLRNGLAALLKNYGYGVLFEANNGKDFIEKLKPRFLPDIVLLDINMPEMDGYETARWIKINYPKIKILALSMYDNENAIIRMLRNGAKGYILKDSDPIELKIAIDALMKKGYYHSELVSGKLIQAVNGFDDSSIGSKNLAQLTEREIELLKYICTELTYKEISEKMGLGYRTVDSCRDLLFEKANVKTRVGLAIYAIKNGIVNL